MGDTSVSMPPDAAREDAPDREHRVMLAAVRDFVHGRSEAAALPAPDPVRLEALAVRHGVLAIVCRSLAAGGAAGEAVARLHATHRAAVARALFFGAELARLTRRLAQAGVDVLPYKGPALAQQIYGDLALRAPADLDLLVAPADFERARALLLADGFHAPRGITPARDRARRLSECDQLLLHRDRGVPVELHWAVAPPCYAVPLRTEDLLARAVPLPFLGQPVRAPAPEDLLLLLAINGAKDAWRQLEPLCALAVLMARGPGLDWPALVGRARALRVERVVGVALRLAADLLGVPVPSPAAESAGDPAAIALARAGAGRLRTAAAPSPLERLRFWMAARESPADRCRYVLRRALTPTLDDCDAIELPAALWPLYFAVRPWRLLGAAAARVGRRRDAGTRGTAVGS